MSAGLKVQEAHDLFREYVEEPDAGFLSSAQVGRYLEYGMDQWRDLIRRHNPHIFNSVVEFHAATAQPSNYVAQNIATKPFRFSLDLGSPLLTSSLIPAGAGAIMGPLANVAWATGAGLSQPPIDTILDLYLYNNETNARGGRFLQVAGGRALSVSAIGSNYSLHGSTIQFNQQPPESFVIEFYPRPLTIDFSYSNNVDYLAGGIIPQFHELIVLLASKRYLIRDGESNQILMGEMAGQLQMFIEYLSSTQLARSRESVTVTTQF